VDDSFLKALRQDPSADFARQLWAQLETFGARPNGRGVAAGHPGRPVRLGPVNVRRWAAVAASVLLIGLAFGLPGVRAAAQAFLDLFRVRNFAAVPISVDRLGALQAAHLSLPELVSSQIEELQKPGPPASFPDTRSAAAAAGIALRLPAWLPVGWELSQVQVLGPRAMRVTASAGKLRQLVQSIGLQDVDVPETIDGKSATVRTSAVVKVTYRHEDRTVTVLQTRSPGVDLPPGLDLPVLGEIGLRILGLSAQEAHRFAQNVDWRTTLVVPVPVNVASFRNVDVQGSQALLLETAQAPAGQRAPGPKITGGPGRWRDETLLLWSAGDEVFALQGTLDPRELLEMAQSISLHD
jgi:hypothetical protein